MRCHYAVLGVSNKANDDELKKSYRKLALQWHPDKNLSNLEEATEKFREIQNAYEVLSDPQERAFYDRNRESILYGADSEEKGEAVNIFDFFNASCFSGFDDSDKGFYTVYRQVFETITAKDLEFVDDPSEVSIPNFGKSDSDLEDVAEFYGYWQSYCTYVSFSWVFEHDIRLATNRWLEKRIEKENKKLRDKAKKKYNEEVRSLVAFIRKRDKRWTSLKKKLEEKVAENARKQEEYQQLQREKRKKWLVETAQTQKESMAEYESQLKAMEAQFAAEWGLSEEEEEECDDEDEGSGEEACEELEEPDNKNSDLYCIACNKIFKTDKAFLNHEQSKKHQENLAALKEYMHEEEAFFTTQANSESSNLNSEKSSSSKKKKKRRNQIKKQEAKRNQECATLEEGEAESHLNEGAESLNEGVEPLHNGEAEDLPCESPNSPDALKLGNAINATSTDSHTVDSRSLGKQKVKPKKPKDKKKQIESTNTSKSASEPICTTCGSTFPSKNKLFAHLKVTGHAALKEASKPKKSKR